MKVILPVTSPPHLIQTGKDNIHEDEPGLTPPSDRQPGNGISVETGASDG